MFAAVGLAALVRSHGGGTKERQALLELAIHPIADVAMTALGHSMALWRKDPQLAWAALWLGAELSFAKRPQRRMGLARRPEDLPEVDDEVEYSEGSEAVPQSADVLARAVNALETNRDGLALPKVPAAWTLIPDRNEPDRVVGAESEMYLRTDFAYELLRHVPFDFVLDDEHRKTAVLGYAE
jgi:hypothetical protein